MIILEGTVSTMLIMPTGMLFLSLAVMIVVFITSRNKWGFFNYML